MPNIPVFALSVLPEYEWLLSVGEWNFGIVGYDFYYPLEPLDDVHVVRTTIHLGPASLETTHLTAPQVLGVAGLGLVAVIAVLSFVIARMKRPSLKV